MVKRKIVNCKKASVRKEPDIVDEKKYLETDVIGYLKKGTDITVDLEDVLYDWTGRCYVKTTEPTPGYIYKGVIN
jgi:hypothetical protein